jgi:Domain of unknown function (DUF4349)
VTSNDIGQPDTTPEFQFTANPPRDAGRSIGRGAASFLRGHGRIARGVALLIAAVVVGAAYVVGGPPLGGATALSAPLPSSAGWTGSSRTDMSLAANMAPGSAPVDQSGFSEKTTTSGSATTTAEPNPLLASIASTQIIKTGQLSLEVSSLDRALSDSQKAIVGLGGTVDSSNRSGTDQYATASITFRVPVAKWDEALSDLRKIGSKVLSEQTGSTDVTTQAVDLDARIRNLQAAETALQSIMARASAIPDIIAVENQLSDKEGQIEQLTAQRDNLGDQAARSTITVTFLLPNTTIITQATQDWTLSGQIDQAGAALVRIGQGLATIAVWLVVVLLPLGLALLLLLGIAMATRRILGRGDRRNAPAGA